MQKELEREAGIKRPVASKHRLTDISHHFLSNENDRLPAWKHTFIIPVLLSSKNDDYIVYELDKMFNKQNRSSMVLNIEASLNEMGSLAPLIQKNNTDAPAGSDEQKLPDFCLIPVTSTSSTLALQSDRLIIAVHSSLPGVRAAYNQLAFLATLETNFNVCVIMIGAKSTSEAKRFFRFLCDSSESFLALELECGGFLLEDSEGIVPTRDENQEVATSLQDVATGILSDLTKGKGRQVSDDSGTTSLPAPHGASVYLT
ncbi:hypothetical protein [Kaarinaea lacus]